MNHLIRASLIGFFIFSLYPQLTAQDRSNISVRRGVRATAANAEQAGVNTYRHVNLAADEAILLVNTDVPCSEEYIVIVRNWRTNGTKKVRFESDKAKFEKLQQGRYTVEIQHKPKGGISCRAILTPEPRLSADRLRLLGQTVNSITFSNKD